MYFHAPPHRDIAQFLTRSRLEFMMMNNVMLPIVMMHGDRWLVVFYFIFFFHVILRSSFCLLSLVPFPCRKFFCFGFGVVIVRRHFSLRHLPLHIFHWFFLFLTENFIKIFVFCSCVPPICVLVLCQCVHALPLLLFL